MTHQIIDNGTITSPQGFSAGAVFSDIKAWRPKPFDLAILRSEVPCTVGAVFTTNKIKAAPVLLCQERFQAGGVQALVVNSGCANACTFEKGFADAQEMASLAGAKTQLSSDQVMVSSTGVIGTYLPMDKIAAGIDQIKLSPDGGHDLAQAIMTTDTVPKEIAVQCEIDGKCVTIGGVAKGAGMIHPDMATMLCFVATDANVNPDFLQEALKRSVDVSFNMISVDGDTSTNDTLMVFANGLAGNRTLYSHSSDAEVFQSALDAVCIYLAKCIVRDGEGATKLIEITVDGAACTKDARIAARAIAGSLLVKTAVYGSDPNWGRVIAAAGRSGADVVESMIDLQLGQMPLMKAGRVVDFDKQAASQLMDENEVDFHLCLNLGDGRATAWGCDLTEEYIALNGDYTT